MLKIVEINPDFAKAVEDNNGYCPCAIEDTDDTICPCKDFREQTEPGECHCGRYEKVEVPDEPVLAPLHPCYGYDKDFDETCGLLEEG